jgi:hypothetical protein
MALHQQLYDRALKAAQALYADKEVEIEQTRESLTSLHEEIEAMLTSLDNA